MDLLTALIVSAPLAFSLLRKKKKSRINYMLIDPRTGVILIPQVPDIALVYNAWARVYAVNKYAVIFIAVDSFNNNYIFDVDKNDWICKGAPNNG